MAIGIGIGVAFGGQGGGRIPEPDFFVDSVNGSDANDGTSIENAFQAIAAAQTAFASSGVHMVLAKGSYWREQFNVPRNGFHISVAGVGAAPVFDGADIATTWTEHADGGSFPDVWQRSWTRTSTNPTGTEYLGLWADGVRLARQTSLANLQANGGWHAANFTGATTTVYIKSVADPNSSGVVYEITRRDWGINAFTGVGSATYTGTLTGPIEAKRALGHYSNINGPGTSVKQALVRDGHIHHAVIAAPLVQDIIATDAYLDYPFAPVYLTAFRAAGAGYNPVWERGFARGPGATVDGTAFLTHSSDIVDSCTLRQWYVKDFKSAIQFSTLSREIEGAYIQDCATGILMGANTTTIQRAVVREPYNVSNEMTFSDLGSPDATPRTVLIENCVVYASERFVSNMLRVADKAGSYVIRNCTFVFVGPAPSIATFLLLSSNAPGLSLSVQQCVFVYIGELGVKPINCNDAEMTVTADHNLYIGGIGPWFNMPTLYTSLASAQAAGYDVHSEYAVHTDVATTEAAFFRGAGSFAAGDFRLKAGLGNFSDGVSKNLCGPQTHWDWNARASVAGAPVAWPVPPANLTEDRAYISDPEAWDFYPDIPATALLWGAGNPLEWGSGNILTWG